MIAKIMFLPMHSNELANGTFMNRLLGERPKLITLENGTCTYRAASMTKHLVQETHGLEIELVEVPSFQEGRKLLKESSPNHLMITPCIHEVTYQLGSDSDVWPTKGLDFILTNPPIYFASRKNGPTLTSSERKVATIKPLTTCLSPDKDWEIVETNSTQDAARRVAAGLVPFCITNAEGVQANNLQVLDRGEDMHMLWRFFKKKSLF